MSAEAAILTRTFRVGKRTCTLTVPPIRGGICSTVMEWDPDVPRRLSKKELRQYRNGRDAALADLAAQLGGDIAVAEV